MMNQQVVNNISLLGVILLITLSLTAPLSFAYTEEKGEVIGKVITIVGEAKAIKENKTERVLRRGDAIYERDIISTDEQSQVQLRFTDGSVLSLRKASRYYIEEYEYQEEVNENKKFFAHLVEGGFRTVTGAIGKENHDEYRIRTPVSIMGIRGTDYSAVLENDMLYVAVWEGIVVLTNNKGQLLIGQNQNHSSAVVTNEDAQPRGLNNVPAAIRTCQYDDNLSSQDDSIDGEPESE